VFSPDEAALVSVGAAEVRAGVDIVVRLASTSSIAGTIVNNGGRAASEIEITLNRTGQTGPPSGAMRTIVRPDGSFRLAGVTPGRYLLVARALSQALYDASFGKAPAGAPAVPGSCMFAAQEMEMTGSDAADVTLALRPCLRLEGRIEGSEAVQGAFVALQPVARSGVPMYTPLRVPAIAGNEGRFSLGEFGDVLPGIYHVNVTLPAAAVAKGWQIASGIIDGQDVMDGPLRIAPDRTAPLSLLLTVTDRRTSLGGSLQPATPRLPSEYTVVAFPVNRDWWAQPYRRVKAVRVAFDGQYQIQDLPAGEYFLAAMSDLAPDEWRDAEFLALVAPAALRITIAAGEQKTQHLKIGR